MYDATLTILDYVEQNYAEPKVTWPRWMIEERSYSLWAINEMLNLLMDRPNDRADITIEEFLIKMELCLCAVKDTKRERIFTIARDTAEDILCLFL